MRGFCNEAWVTVALSDTDVPRALTLSWSLKDVLTTRKLVVIAASQLSKTLKESLHLGFDFVFYLQPDLKPNGISEYDFGKLTAFTLVSFEKIALVSPDMMVTRNCDELFDGTVKDGMIWMENREVPAAVIKPSIKTYNTLLKAIREKRRYAAAANFPNKLDSLQCGIISLKNGLFAGEENDVCIVNLEGISIEELKAKKDLGVFEKLVLERWEAILNSYVHPLLQQNSFSAIMAENTTEHGTSNSLLAYEKEPIAIVGMSCRYPGANNLEEFWNVLLNGEDATGNPPEFRWLKEQCSRNLKDSRKTNAGFLKCPVDDFDAKFFGISPKEMVFLDPQHRLLHELVWEGLEDAAVNPQDLRGTNGSVFIGSWTNNYKEIVEHDGNKDFYRTYMGNSIGAAAARISFLLGMTGPSIATESGCSSAMVAVHLACRSLQLRETNFAMACGVNLLLHPFDKDEMPMVISPEGRCKTFDSKADGFARAEGCGVLVLKRLSDAVKDGDKIWGMIRGSGISQEGISKSLGTPTIHCESLAMKHALKDAVVDPAQISYVEAHGTGTVVGDPMEVAAIAKAYNSKRRKEPLLIGSVKTNVGHTESCSGITGIQKVILAMQHEIIPAHRNFDSLNPTIDLDAVPARIPLKSVDWKKHDGKPRLAGVSSFGITGTDAHVIIEEAPPLFQKALISSVTNERPLHIMKVSAKTEVARTILQESFSNHLENSNEDLKDLAYTANIGRADFGHRAAIIARTKEEAIKCLEQNKTLTGEESSDNLGKVCFLFTGQGSQYPGMAKQLYETSPIFRMHFEYCENILKKDYSIDITKVMWSNKESCEISRTIYSQTSIFCVEYALLRLWESWGIKANYALGHSLGEFAAAVCAGILNVKDAIKLVAERSRLIDELPRGKMLVIKADNQKVDTLMRDFSSNNQHKMLDFAAINSKEQTVVAGDADVVLHFGQFCKVAGIKCMVLEATHAFHSKHMDPMLNHYKVVANTVKNMGGNDCHYISGMLGTSLDTGKIDAQYWVQHTREKVKFMEASKKAVELGCKIFIEVGPQPVLSALTMMNNDTQLLCLPSLKKTEGEWETMLNTLGKLYVKGMEINWKGLDQFCNRKKVRLPHYPFIGKKYWPDMVATAGSTIHPLLGSPISNASSAKLFQSRLNLSSMEYVKDHTIGHNIIFPGAGYLEMCLAAGLATIEGSTTLLPPPTRAMKVENLFIEAPLSLIDSKTCQVQTVVELNEDHGDWNDMKVSIFRRAESETGKWISHAKATFSPIPNSEDKAVPFDLNQFHETLKQPSNDRELSQIYDKLASVGLKFGPTFRSIEKIWRSNPTSNLKTLLAKVKVPTGDDGLHQYIVHPVVLDAMIQAIMMLRNTSSIKKKLYVPIKIGQFVWLQGMDTSSSIYIHAYDSGESHSSASALLVDSTGSILAIMSSVDLIDTTVKAIDSILEQQRISMPEMWEEVWKPQLGPLQHRLALKDCVDILDSESKKSFERFNNPGPHLAKTFSQLEELCHLYFLKAFYDCGWKPTPGQILKEDAFQQELGILPKFQQYFRFILKTFESEDILDKIIGTGDTEWKVKNVPPPLSQLVSQLSSPSFTTELSSKFHPTLLLSKYGENLGAIMRGEGSALSILFPEENKGYPSVFDFYNEYGKLFLLIEGGNAGFRHRFTKFRSVMKDKRFILRILEIGAGTGSYSSDFINCMDEEGIEFEYTYTDISSAFFPAAQKKFEKYAKQMKFKKLNIEEDPLEQGFSPEYFDYVYMAEVIHATRDIRESLRNIRVLMKPYALLDIMDQTRVNKIITYLFGGLDGFWRFQDYDIRSNHCTISPSQWEMVIAQTGFEIDGCFPIFFGYHSIMGFHKTEEVQLPISSQNGRKVWLLFVQENCRVSRFLKEKLENGAGRRVICVRREISHDERGVRKDDSIEVRSWVEEDFHALFKSMKAKGLEVEGIVYCWALNKEITSQDEILQPYFYLTKAVISLPAFNPRLVAVTDGAHVPLMENDMSHFHASTLWAYTKTVKNEDVNLNCSCIELNQDENVNDKEQRLWELLHEIWNDEKETQVAFSKGTRLTPKLVAYKPLNNLLQLPKGTDKFQLILPETRAIPDLQFGPLQLGNLKEDEVEVQIEATALNFRDVLSVIKPSEEFQNINTVGFDFAGVIKKVGEKVIKWKAGDRVFGCNIYLTPLPSHVIVNEDVLLPVPNTMPLCEAATLPAVYMTSVLCLMEVAKIKKGDTVLIHTASGGVGLSAIEICKHVGCTIIATAGSKRKQNYLRSLGIQHIFHSRNTQFGEQILELTNGRGVDVVLNSLTSEGFKESTLKACAKGARFVEMSKLNIWSKEDVKEFRPDVEYTVADLSQSEISDWKRLVKNLKMFQEEGIVKPIPYVRFDALNVREALSYMQKAKHIGKIVCVMPELKHEDGKLQIYTPMFSDRSTYLITGGLGGIGFVVCRWMINSGARHIILASRRPPSSSIQAEINGLNSGGANVIAVQLDVSSLEQCKDLIETQIGKMGLPPLKGVMHAAGTLTDGVIVNLDWPKMSSPFSTKINGTINLHELTKNLNLEHFVVFSSTSSIFGPPAQSNYAAGNCFQDAITHYRHSMGLPSTTVNWGQWGEVGVAIEADLAGVKPFSNWHGISALEHVLKTQRTQTCVLNVSSFVLMSKYIPQISKYLDERIWKKSTVIGIRSVTIKSEEFWQQFDSAIDLEEKHNLFKVQLRSILRNTLKLDENEAIGDDVDMQEMGVDSLMFVEIKNGLQTLLGERLTVSASSLKDSNTVNLISSTMVGLIEGADDEDKSNYMKPTFEEVNSLIKEDSKLPEHIRAKVGQEVVSLGGIKTVLLTGCTGTLGPYILKELTKRPQIIEVVCLIRPTKSVPLVEERLRNVLNSWDLLSKIDMKKIRCVSGNVAQPNLGLKPNVWSELSEKVDAIINCAAYVVHTEHYRKINSQKDMRAVNIGGIKNLLEFACENKLKYVYHASTLVTAANIDESSGRLSEKWPEIEDFENVTTLGYPVTKFVTDVLIKEAVTRGIPAKIFRLPVIVGELETGRCSIAKNHIFLRYLFIMKHGMMPSLPMPMSMLPVDTCAEVTLRLFFDEKAPLGVYNIAHANPDVDQAFVEVAKRFGRHVDVVDFEEFSKRVLEADSGDGFSAFKEFYTNDDAMVDLFSSPTLKKWLEGNELEDHNIMWRSSKVESILPGFYESQARQPTMEFVYRNLSFLKSEGLFEKLGL